MKNDIPAKPAAELDMYADDFDEKEKANLTAASTSNDDVEPEESKNKGIPSFSSTTALIT